MIGEGIPLSTLDTARFGVRVGRSGKVGAAEVAGLVEAGRRDGLALWIARCPAEDTQAVHALEQAGGRLCDTLVYYSRKVAGSPPPEAPLGTVIRPAATTDLDAVREVAGRSFAGYQGHYHADPRLDRAQCDAGYIEWAQRSVASREVADEVLIAEEGGRVLGFATLKVASQSDGEGVLFGVAPEAQGRGLYRALMLHGLDWCKGRGTATMTVSTQLSNLAVQKVWCRLGFEPRASLHTFHLWL